MKPNVKPDIIVGCQGCGEEQLYTPGHTCPFKSDIHGDDETLCNCCEDCVYDCLMSI